MTKQCEALRLADALDEHQFDEPHAAAAELRRLHDENQRLRLIVPEVLEDLNDKLCDENERLIAQRDRLLEALKDLMQQYKDQPECFMDWSKARAAIKAVVEE